MKRKDKDEIEINQLSSTKKETVCAVVVTYNRKTLLLECLEALRKQTRPLDAIYIIDNASTDDTPEVLLKNNYIPELPPSNLEKTWENSFLIANFPIKINNSRSKINIHYVRMNENTGGAGGFYEGVKRGYEKGYDWLWLMDDDVLPKRDSLESLINSLQVLNKESIGFISSSVVSADNRSMNVPSIDNRATNTGYSDWKKYLSMGIVALRSATFVSLLVSSDVIKNVGFPCKDFFIWGDDTEYTLRITEKYKGFLVGKSIVIHNRANVALPSVFLENNLSRIRMLHYSYRNSSYIAKKYYSKKVWISYLLGSIYTGIKIVLSNKKYKKERVIAIFRGLLSSIFFRPRL